MHLKSQGSILIIGAGPTGIGAAYRLKNLEQRRCIVKSGPERWCEVEVPTVRAPQVDYTDLLNRSRYTHGRVRTHIEQEIRKRQHLAQQSTDDALYDWK